MPAGVRDFSLLHIVSTALESTQPPIQWVLGVNRTERDVQYSPPSSTEVNNVVRRVVSKWKLIAMHGVRVVVVEVTSTPPQASAILTSARLTEFQPLYVFNIIFL
jgi:hypothetical protein